MNKILFVCRANAGRSQMAMELFNQLRPGGAESAGTHVDQPGQQLKDRPAARSAIAVMRELGVDMSNNARRQLEPQMLDSDEHLIVLAETKAIPSYLNTYPGAEFWHVEDSRFQPLAETRKIRDRLQRRVAELAQRLQPALDDGVGMHPPDVVPVTSLI